MMNEISARDAYPRIIRFDETFQELEIAAQDYILWPCSAYTIAVPTRSKNRLNVFEELVLKLTALGNGDTKEIAEFSCLEEDIVLFIQNKLNQQGFINKYFSITNSGKQLIEQWKTDALKYTVATVYQDSVTGVVLPFINLQEPSYEEVEEYDSKFIKFSAGTTGKKRSFKARVIRIRGNSPSMLSQADVLKAIKQYRQRLQCYAALRKTALPPPPYIQGSAISIQTKPEQVYLYCRIILPRGNPDILLVSDGFGLGYSEHFSAFLQKQSWSWLTDIKERGIVEKDNEDKKEDVSSDPLEMVCDVMNKWKNTQAASTADEKKKKEDIERAITILYDTLEHSLSASVFEFPVDEWANNYEKGSYEENKRFVEKFARKMGFEVNEKNTLILEAIPGKIRAFREGSVELQPLLALAITGARYHSVHPLNIIAAEYPDFLTFAVSLKQLRDPTKDRYNWIAIYIRTII